MSKKVRVCKCPTCGTLYQDPFPFPYELGDCLPMTGTNLVIYRMLAANFGRFVDKQLIISCLYSASKEGGPEYAANIVAQGLTYLRKMLLPYGLKIETSGGRNAGSTRHKLCWETPL